MCFVVFWVEGYFFLEFFPVLFWIFFPVFPVFPGFCTGRKGGRKEGRKEGKMDRKEGRKEGRQAGRQEGRKEVSRMLFILCQLNEWLHPKTSEVT